MTSPDSEGSTKEEGESALVRKLLTGKAHVPGEYFFPDHLVFGSYGSFWTQQLMNRKLKNAPPCFQATHQILNQEVFEQFQEKPEKLADGRVDHHPQIGRGLENLKHQCGQKFELRDVSGDVPLASGERHFHNKYPAVFARECTSLDRHTVPLNFGRSNAWGKYGGPLSSPKRLLPTVRR